VVSLRPDAVTGPQVRQLAVTAVVAVRNDPVGLNHTLAALRDQSLDAGQFEVVVVDDASSDGTAAVARTFAGVRVIVMNDRRGSYAARNRGLALARGRYIAITDADCRPHPDWLEQGLSYLARDEQAVIGGHISMPLPQRPSLAAMVDVIHHLDQQRYVEESGCAVTANLFASAATFASVGGFNDRMQSSGDVEWTRRARLAGHRLVFAPEAVVVHPPRSEARALLRKARRVAEGGRAANRQGLLAGRAPYLDPWCLVPWQRERGRLRLRENGADPGPIRWLLVGLAQVSLVQVAQAAYALAADIRAWRGRSTAR
jgi:glycosyltransferase involved in cell wall biosynthesis